MAQSSKDKDAEKPRPQIGEKDFRIYDGQGKEVSMDRLCDALASAEVVFLGELHDDPVAHHLQEKILVEAHRRRAKNQPLALSLEMFERDVQFIIDEYLTGLISEQHFLSSARPWKNYKDDYRPLVEFAKAKGLAVIAANAPRRYVNRVGRLGAASLKDIPEAAQRGLPPLPYASASAPYRKKFQDIMSKHGSGEPKKNAKKKEHANKDKDMKTEKGKSPKTLPPPKFDLNKALEAQSLWDASMAYSIATHLLHNPGSQIIHLNGSFHSDSRLGIPEHLTRYRPGTSLLVVTMISDKSFPNFNESEMRGRGDFVIVTNPVFRKSAKAKETK